MLFFMNSDFKQTGKRDQYGVLQEPQVTKYFHVMFIPDLPELYNVLTCCPR